MVPTHRWSIEGTVWLIAGIVLLASTALAALHNVHLPRVDRLGARKLKTIAAAIDERHAATYGAVGAFALYLDSLNVFLMLLRLVVRRERR